MLFIFKLKILFNLLDILFLVLIAVFVPIIVFVGMKIYDYKNIRKVVIALTFVFLALELLRFFCNARFYDNATTPKGDVKFGIVTVLCIFSLFATFNNNKYLGNLMRNVFILTALAPIITAIFYPITYINALDVNGVCKAFYMLECGFTLTLALLYVKTLFSSFSFTSFSWFYFLILTIFHLLKYIE